MKATRYIISILMLATLILSSCDKVPMNGDLDGLWQLTEIHNGDDVQELKNEKLYCSFQLHLFMLGDKTSPRHYYGYFEKDAKQLRFHTFTYRSNYTEDNNYDNLMTDEKDLAIIAPWGFYSTDCTYDVVRLNSQELILKHDDTTIIYRKL